MVTENIGWAVFFLEVPHDTEVQLSFEHNDFTWVSVEDARTMCQPERLAASVRTAVEAVDNVGPAQ